MRASLRIVAITLCTGAALFAQEANPISANLKRSWTNISGLIAKEAEKMPADDYSFKPTADIQNFGQRMAHEVGFTTRMCALLQGKQMNPKFADNPTKAEVTSAVTEMKSECDPLFSSLTDAELMKTMSFGRGGQRLKLAVVEGAILEHSQEMYGYMAVYLRLKGIVPPSSDRNER